MHLSDVFVRNVKADVKARKYADGDGLFLYVTITGAKSWRFRYRDFCGREQEMVLGSYPLKSLLDVRKERFEARKLLEHGIDPKQEKRKTELLKETSAVNTFKVVAEEWFELNHEKLTQKHRQKVQNSLKNHVYPVFGKLPIAEFDELAFLQKIIRPLEKKGHTDLTHRLLCYCTSIFRYAKITKRVSYNPLLDLVGALKPNEPDNLPAIRISELPEMLERLDNHKACEIDKLAVKALTLTFVRTNELRKARKADFDFDKGLWTIPAEIMKMRKEHIVPLSRQATAVFHRAFELSANSEYVFPTKNFVKHPYMNENVVNRLLHDMEYRERHCGHGFRQLASTTLNESGRYHFLIIEKQLAHEDSNKVRAAYNKAEYLEQRIELMQYWADHIDCVVLEHKIKNQKKAA